MKKLLSFIAVMAINASAYTLNIQPGWQLKGALSDINASQLNNSNIRSVWTYDSNTQKWRAYLPNNSSLNLSKYGIENLQKIEEGEGFWVNAKSNVSVNIPSEMNNNNGSQGQGQISLTNFLNNLNFTPLSTTFNNFSNKLVLNDDGSIIFFNNDGTYKDIEDNGKIYSGNWSVQNNIVELNESDGDNDFIAIKDKNGSLMAVKGYDSGEGFWNDTSVVLNATENTTVNSASDYLALFDQNTPINNISDSDFAGKKIATDPDVNESLSFDSNGTFTDSWIEDGKIYSKDGNWNVDNNVLSLNYNTDAYGGVKKAFVVYINNNQKAVYLAVDKDGKTIAGGISNF